MVPQKTAPEDDAPVRQVNNILQNLRFGCPQLGQKYVSPRSLYTEASTLDTRETSSASLHLALAAARPRLMPITNPRCRTTSYTPREHQKRVVPGFPDPAHPGAGDHPQRPRPRSRATLPRSPTPPHGENARSRLYSHPTTLLLAPILAQSHD